MSKMRLTFWEKGVKMTKANSQKSKRINAVHRDRRISLSGEDSLGDKEIAVKVRGNSHYCN